MARGVRKSIDEKVLEIESKISELTQKKIDTIAKIDEAVDALLAQKEELERDKKIEQLSKLQSIIDQLGITPEDAVKKLQA